MLPAPLDPLLLQTPFVLLNRCLTAGTAFGDELGQVLALGLHAHAVIVAAIIDPLGHVATAGRVVCLGGEVRGTVSSATSHRVCEDRRWAGKEWDAHLWETTAEAGGPAALGAGGPATQALAAQDPVTALRVGAPCQVGAAFHIASQKGLLILWADASADAMNDERQDSPGGSKGSGHQKASLPAGSMAGLGVRCVPWR